MVRPCTAAKKAAAGALLGACLIAAGNQAWGQDKSLVSIGTDQAPAIDGVVDAVWAKAPPLSIPLDKSVYQPSNGYKGIKKTVVTLKSLHDADTIYFLAQWTDPSESLGRWPWVKQAKGGWVQLKSPDSTGSENTSYDDQLGLIWNINAKAFEVRGCASQCHKARDGRLAGFDDKLPGRKYSNNPGESVDLWVWKAALTNPVGQMDDGYIDDTKDPRKNAEWGLHRNDSTGGGYAANVNAAKTGPAFMNAAVDGPKFWVLADRKAPIADRFKAGDTVGGAVLAPFAGARGNVQAKGVWAAGKWTLEFKRRLVTAGANAARQDVQFGDLKKTYPFGLSIFDNTEINHLYVEGVQTLTFK